MTSIFGEVYIVIPVHNRKETTIACLANISSDVKQLDAKVIVVDDGSTDGTTNAIKSSFPEVIIIQGDGNLWWTGAILKGMQYAYEKGANFVIWLNDDTFIKEGALITLVESSKDNCTISGAQCYEDQNMLSYSYSGHKKYGLFFKHVNASGNEVIECGYLAGNCVCIPRSVISTIGFPDAMATPHYFGDVIYTYKAYKRGFKLKLVGGAKAICNKKDATNSKIRFSLKKTLASKKPLDLLQSYFSIKSPTYPIAKWNKEFITLGIIGMIIFLWLYLLILISTSLSLVIPGYIKRKVFSS